MHIKIGLRPLAAAVVAIATFDLGACASDAHVGAKEGAGGESGKANADAGIYGELGITPPSAQGDDGGPTPAAYEFDKVNSPYPDAAGCKDFSSPDTPKGDHADVRACLCDNCFMLQQECDALQGCQQILKCMLDVGCTTANNCYLAPQKTALDPDGKGCVAVIDQWGNAGVSTALSNQIGDCSTAHSCRPTAGK